MVLFLIGYMGSGKTTLGKRVASELGWRFIDMDKEIETRAGATISEIFASRGEEAFRQMERDFIRSLEGIDFDAVVSTGGGAPCRDDNMERMNAIGTTLYLRVPTGALIDRLRNSHTKRPLLDGKSVEELTRFVSDTVREREAYYMKADHVIEGVGIRSDHIIAALKNDIKRDDV